MIKQTIGRVKTASKVITRSEMDVLDLLRSDHMKVEVLLAQLRFIRDADRRASILKQVKSELDRHMMIEEEVLYPTCGKHPELSDLVEHSYDEHEQVRDLLRSLGKKGITSQSFSKTVTQLITTIEEHVNDEEDELFPKVRKVLSESEFKRLNRDILEIFSFSGRRSVTKKAA